MGVLASHHLWWQAGRDWAEHSKHAYAMSPGPCLPVVTPLPDIAEGFVELVALEVRSVNLTLTIVNPAAAQVVMRRGCTFATGSAKPTKGCQRSLRVVSQRLPRDAIGLRIAIIGVSVDELTRPANRALARKRARAVAVYLRGLGVRGTYVRTTMIAKSGPKSPLAARSVIVRNGQPRTTVTFSFTR